MQRSPMQTDTGREKGEENGLKRREEEDQAIDGVQDVPNTRQDGPGDWIKLWGSQEGFLGRHWVSEDESLEKSKMKRWMENLRG